MSPRRFALLLALAAGLVFAACPLPGTTRSVAAQDGGDEEKKDDKEREKTPEEKELIAIGKEFNAKDSTALLKRVPEKRRVRLILGSADKRYGGVQAKEVLDAWFESRELMRVKLKKTSGSVGEFELKLRRKEDEPRDLVLVIRIAKEDDVFVLKSIEVSRE